MTALFLPSPPTPVAPYHPRLDGIKARKRKSRDPCVSTARFLVFTAAKHIEIASRAKGVRMRLTRNRI